MSILRGKIKIELQSDLCVGSGYSYAGIVDSDVCYDDFGIPYIPAKRLKGCMRETLETLLYIKYPECADNLFGKRGESDYDSMSDESGTETIRIGNAYIEDYSVIYGFISKHQKYNDKKQYEVQDILDRFTHVVGQTKMENGVADNSSLRYTRVVNRYYPMEKTGNKESKPMIFIAEISVDEKYKEEVADILKATRHIGLKRNRGFGMVKCTVKYDISQKTTDVNTIAEDTDKKLVVDELGDDVFRIHFALRNTEPLMLSGIKEDVTKDYITAQSVIGALAGRYIKKYGKQSAYTDEFKDLFLNGSTQYSHLYPCVGGRIHYPAPDYLTILKKSKKYVYTLEGTLPEASSLPEDKRKDYDYGDGNQPKKLKGKFISLTQRDLSVMEVSKDIIYHNRHSHDEDDGILYSSEVITPGQVFAGYIDVHSKKCKDELLSLIKDDDFYFGKSRSAQYGHCEKFDAGKISFEDHNDDKIEAGHPMLITFLSDTILLKEKDDNDILDPCEYTVYFDEIKQVILKALDITEYVNQQTNGYISSIQTTLVTGYKGVWNLRRSPIPAVKAGSYLVVYTDKDYTTSKFSIGEFVHEGYGSISITRAENYTYLNVPEKIDSGIMPDSSCGMIEAEQKEKIKSIIVPILVKKWLDKKISVAISNYRYMLKGTESAVGRFKLMLMESIAKNEGCEETYNDFKNRIKAIKNDSSKDQGKKLIYWANDFMEDALKTDECIKTLKDFGQISWSDNDIKNIRELMKDSWSDYIMAILVNRKYMGRGE